MGEAHPLLLHQLPLPTSCSDCTSLQDGSEANLCKLSKGPGADPGHQPGGFLGRSPRCPLSCPLLRVRRTTAPGRLWSRVFTRRGACCSLGLLGNQGGAGGTVPSSPPAYPPTFPTDPQPQEATLKSGSDPSSCAHLPGSAPWPFQLPAAWQPPAGEAVAPPLPHPLGWLQRLTRERQQQLREGREGHRQGELGSERWGWDGDSSAEITARY